MGPSGTEGSTVLKLRLRGTFDVLAFRTLSCDLCNVIGSPVGAAAAAQLL